MSLLITGARVIDPTGERRVDVRVVGAVISEVAEHLAPADGDDVIDAAGLVLASDQDAARAYAAIVQRVTGHVPALILSDDPKASQRIGAFTTSTERYAVCVRMISEGVDVPRAACLAWMTSYRTPLFFAQAVGRVVRARRPGESATVFLPAVRPLLALAAEIESERNHVLPPPAGVDDEELYDPLPPELGDEQPLDTWQALGAEAEFAHVLHGGRAVTGTVDLTGDDADYLGLPGLLTPEQTASLLMRRDADHRRRASATLLEEATQDTGADDERARADALSWRAAGELRREINSLVGQLAARAVDPGRAGNVGVLDHRIGVGHVQLVADQHHAERRMEVFQQRGDQLGLSVAVGVAHQRVRPHADAGRRAASRRAERADPEPRRTAGKHGRSPAAAHPYEPRTGPPRGSPVGDPHERRVAGDRHLQLSRRQGDGRGGHRGALRVGAQLGPGRVDARHRRRVGRRRRGERREERQGEQEDAGGHRNPVQECPVGAPMASPEPTAGRNG